MICELTIFSWTFLLAILLLALLKVFHKLWWAPNRYQRFMESQGIRGPSYELIHGNKKEVTRMESEAASKPLSSLTHDIFPRLQPHVHLWTKLYGKNYIQWMGSRAQLMVTDVELAKEVLIDRNGVFLKPKINNGFLLKILGDGIISSNGAKWAKMRKLGNHAFHAERLKGMIPLILSSCEELMDRLRLSEGKAVDVRKEFKLVTSEVISSAAFGSTYKEGHAIFESLGKLGLLAFQSRLGQTIPGMVSKNRDHAESVELEKSVRESITGIIKKREEKAMKEGGEFGEDFLGVLLNAHYNAKDEKQRISMEQIIEECKVLYSAGQETTNVMLAWIIVLLSANPEWQENTRKEVLELFGKQNLTPDGISKLKNMGMVINETLRLYPPVLMVGRSVKQNIRLGKVMIPAGSEVVISILAIHHDPEIWGDDVHVFKPERFSEGVAKATKGNIAAFIPFGLGARSCLGLNFAVIEAKIALAMILQRYSFSLSPSYLHSPDIQLILKPHYGVQVMFQPL